MPPATEDNSSLSSWSTPQYGGAEQWYYRSPTVPAYYRLFLVKVSYKFYCSICRFGFNFKRHRSTRCLLHCPRCGVRMTEWALKCWGTVPGTSVLVVLQYQRFVWRIFLLQTCNKSCTRTWWHNVYTTRKFQEVYHLNWWRLALLCSGTWLQLHNSKVFVRISYYDSSMQRLTSGISAYIAPCFSNPYR